MMGAIRLLVLAAAVLTACAPEATPAPASPVTPSGGPAPTPTSTATAAVRLPPVTGSFDYQLGGAADNEGLTVVVRDVTAKPMPGAYDICYVNGFQTQPGEGERWLHERGSAVLKDGSGAPVTDPDWPDEYVLDPSTPAQRKIILDALGPEISDCAAKGFEAVDIDNLDTFSRFTDPASGRIDEAGAIELARSYAAIAHQHGLAVGQKNAPELAGTVGHQVGFDFAVAEECAAFQECESYAKAYGPHVLQIEYTDNLPGSFEQMCATPGRAPLTILRDRDLVAPGDEGYVRRQCP